MNLWDDSFRAINEGWKTVEMRLNDEKRSVINVGDVIEMLKNIDISGGLLYYKIYELYLLNGG
ncbi:hypothetical protein [Butyrivibrio sp. MC2013]|uniref:hypothetical protein n=1 Tax=Butyrivibrio sp. MC2013 TaxID=1280686 RepID=UPI0012DC53F4|nr:hypothetical protein [Butyrivibrio sp. MC2013]